MNSIKFFLFAISCAFQPIVLGQSGRILKNFYGDWPFVECSENGVFKPIAPTYAHDYYLSGATFSECNGTPLFVNDFYSIRYISNGKNVKGCDELTPTFFNDFFIRRNDTTIDLFGLHDSAFLYYVKEQNQFGLYQHTLVKNNYQWENKFKNKFYKVLPVEHIYYYKNDFREPYYFGNDFLVNRIKSFKYQALFSKQIYDVFKGSAWQNRAINYSSLNIFQIINGVLSQTDEMKFPSGEFVFHDPIPINIKGKVFTPVEMNYIVSSHRTDKIFISAKAALYGDTLGRKMELLFASGLYVLEFDSTKEKILRSEPKRIISSTFYNHHRNIEYTDPVVSSNDSILYFIDINKLRTPCYMAKYVRFRENEFIIDTLYTSNSQFYMFLSPYGQLIISHDQADSGSYLHLIVKNPNNPNGLKTPLVRQRMDVGFRWSRNRHFTYDYIRIKNSVNYTCKAEVSFKNQSDLSEGLDSFVWFFSSPKGDYTDTVIGFEPKLNYYKSGKYPFKVHGFSGNSQYSEWFFDSVEVDIPKPLTYFNTSDTQICAYNKVTFYSKSVTLSDQPAKPSTLTWFFGDGNSKSQNTLLGEDSTVYSYQKPGRYSVSLNYNNGYCDSTFTRTFWMQIMESPKPGFQLNKSVDCAPFELEIIDTVTHFVRSKEYYFSDSQDWKTVVNNKIHKTIHQPGGHYVVQKLYGFNGCITQMDTAFIWVRPGVSRLDTSHVLNATYVNELNNFKEEPTVILLNWQTWPGVKNYTLLRDGVKWANTSTNFYYDTLKVPHSHRYEVVANDSCGNQTSPGKIGKPILLTGEISSNNEYAILRFTDYENWESSKIDYQLQRIENSSIQPKVEVIYSSQKGSEFKDETYRKEGELEQCYRVEGRGSSGQITYSNILCLPYATVVYIPNTFTPNADGKNDIFEPTMYGVKSYTLKIYSRWGEKLYEGNSGWPGLNVPSGSYIYEIEFISNQNDRIFKNGIIQVLK